MAEKGEIYKCDICGNVVRVLEGARELCLLRRKHASVTSERGGTILRKPVDK
jgi:desulfoferrodoxin-like iron-binding protein